MEDKTTNGLKEQRERRKRINRIKTGMITAIIVWMLVSMILCITLLCKVISLQKQIDTLASSGVLSGQVSDDKIHANGVPQEDTQEVSDTENEGGNVPVSSSNAIMANDESNRAEEGDHLKAYLTFDDGPSANTAAILDTLKEYNVKATFFVVGKEDEESKAMYQRIVDEGHTLAMHSYSHKYSTIYESLDNFKADYEQIQNYLYDVTGEDCMYYRFPGGSSNQVSNTDMHEFIDFLDEEGVTYFDWNVSSGDATSQAYTAEELVDNVLRDVVKYKTSVVLLHDADAKDTTVEALGPMIEALQNAGVELLPIDEDTTVIQHMSVNSVQ